MDDRHRNRAPESSDNTAHVHKQSNCRKPKAERKSNQARAKGVTPLGNKGVLCADLVSEATPEPRVGRHI